MTRWVRVACLLSTAVPLGLPDTQAAEGSAKETIPALEVRLAGAVDGERLAILLDLSEALNNVDPARQISTGREALALARALGDGKGQARALFAMGSGQLDRGETAEAIASYDEARGLYSGLGDTPKEFDCIKNVGWAQEDAGRIDEALASYESALAFAKQAGFQKGEAVALGLTGIILMSKDDYAGALERFLRALTFHEASGNETQVAVTLSYVGSAFSAMEEYDKALPRFERALAGMRKAGNEANAAIVLSEIGIVHTHQRRFDEAIAAFEEALEISTRIDDRMNIGRVLGNLAGTYSDLRDFDRAAETYAREIAIWRAIGNESLVASSLANLASMELERKNCAQARAHASESLRFAEREKSRHLQYTNLANLAKAEACLGRHAVAYAALLRASEIKDELAGAEARKAYARLEVQYEAEKKTRQIDTLRRDLEMERLRVSEGRLRIGLVLSGFALLLALFAILFRRYLHLLAFWKKRTYIGHYRIERQIGLGGMGIVYEARDLVHGGSAALKVIREEHASDPDQRRRFLREGDIIDRLGHPGIVRVFERGEQGGNLFIAMELLSGTTLAERLSSGARFPLPEALPLMLQLTAAIAEIHRHGVVHRDIKPENVMLVTGEELPTVKLLDFGLARAPSVSRLTETGQILGTLHYLAPELITERTASAASDIFALGSVFYEMLTCEKPFLGENPGAIVRAILEEQPIPPYSLRAEVPKDLSSLVLRMLGKRGDLRPSSQDVLLELQRAA